MILTPLIALIPFYAQAAKPVPADTGKPAVQGDKPIMLTHTFKKGEIIRVGILIEQFTGRKRWAVEVVALTVATAFTLYFTWYAVAMTYDSFRFNDMAQGVLAIPLWMPQLGYSGGLVILAVALVDELVHVLKGNKPSYEKEPPSSPDEFVERIASGGGG
jgi:TRAP-type C4-dicarboxylate transport system permease small subunit